MKRKKCQGELSKAARRKAQHLNDEGACGAGGVILALVCPGFDVSVSLPDDLPNSET